MIDLEIRKGYIERVYRILHRGLGNGVGRERPVAYAALSTGLAWDRANFPTNSLYAHAGAGAAAAAACGVPEAGFPTWGAVAEVEGWDVGAGA